MYGTPEEYYELAERALARAERRCALLEGGNRGIVSAERRRHIADEELKHAARILRLADPPEEGVYIPMLWEDGLNEIRAEAEKVS